MTAAESGVVTLTGGSPLTGEVRVPGDKSISHRALLLAALAEGTSTITGLSDGDDVRRTRLAVEALGADVVDGAGSVTVHGGRSRLHAPAGAVDLGNSGTGMRLLLGLLAGLPLTAFAGLLRSATDDALALGPRAALTGPAARGDWETVQRHRTAIASMPAHRTELAGYDAMVALARRLSLGTAEELDPTLVAASVGSGGPVSAVGAAAEQVA